MKMAVFLQLHQFLDNTQYKTWVSAYSLSSIQRQAVVNITEFDILKRKDQENYLHKYYDAV